MEKKLTSVHVLKNLYKNFKILSIDDDINFQKLVNRALELYNNDLDFRNKINNKRDIG